MSSAGSLLDRLQVHLRDLETDPSAKLDEQLFESCSLAITQTISQETSISVISQLSKVLPDLHHDPTPAIQLLIRLLEPYTFSQILSLNPNTDFVGGLNVRALPYNRLVLALLDKATTNATDAATIAAKPEVVAALVRLWLSTHDTGVAQEAGDTLLALLKVDQQAPPGSGQDPLPAHSQGLMWKRVFGDEDIYALMFSICSLKSIDATSDLTKSQRTLAQARLLERLPTIGALNWNAITKNHHPGVESLYTDGKGEGLLYFAATSMVDTRDDVLMHRCLIDFFAELHKKVQNRENASSAHSSISLDFLIAYGLHDRSLSFYLDPTDPQHDPVDLQFVYAPSAHYLAAYASHYPNHFMGSAVKDETLQRLTEALDLSPSRWAHAASPKHDLHILASLPRAALLPRLGQGSSAWAESPLSLLPSKSTNPDVLDTLASVFHGPVHQEIVNFPLSKITETTEPQQHIESQLARALYYLYLNNNPRLFEDLVKHAETIALEPDALAAINVITSIATAKWLPLPGQSSEGAPGTITESDLLAWLPSTPTATPNSGALALLAPPALEHALPYLLRPPQTFSNIVGGLGDTENSAYKIAVAKFDALKKLSARLEDRVVEEPGQGYEEIVETLKKRIAEGPWGRQAQAGTSVATMEL